MDSKEYEELVADVCGELCSVPGAVIRHNQRLRGNSGHEHQIDVVIEYPGPVRLLILVECKYWTHPVTVEEVLVLAQRLTDTGAHKGIIVTRIGFQPGALKVAQARGIALVRYEPQTFPQAHDAGVPDRQLEVILRRATGSSVPPSGGKRHDGGHSYVPMTGPGAGTGTTFPAIVDWLARNAEPLVDRER